MNIPYDTLFAFDIITHFTACPTSTVVDHLHGEQEAAVFTKTSFVSNELSLSFLDFS